MRALRTVWYRPEVIASCGAIILAASVFWTLPAAQSGAEMALVHDRHGGQYITMIAMVPIQLAAFAGVLALVQSQHISVAIGVARIIAGLGLALLYTLGLMVAANAVWPQRLIGPGLVVAAELLRRAATWQGHSPFQVARFGAVGSGVASGLIGFVRYVEPHQPVGVSVALSGAALLFVGCLLTMLQLHRTKRLPTVPTATVA